MIKATATLFWSLDVECPHCKDSFDLVDTDSDNDYSIANKIFNNQWDALNGKEVQCPNCCKEFELEKVEY